MGKRINRTPERAIIDKCYECCCGQGEEVIACKIVDCPLFIYRQGFDETLVNQAKEEIKKQRKKTSRR